MRFLPLAIDLRDRACTVVGGGAVGSRKVRTLLRAGAAVTVVSPDVTDEVAAEAEAGRVRWVRARFVEEHVDGVHLLIMATDDDDLNAAGVRLAGERGVLVCDASSRDRSQVIFGALLEHEDGSTVATFTDGRDPAGARRARDRIAALLTGATAAGGSEDTAPAIARETVFVLFAHGSRNEHWADELTDLVAWMRTALRSERVRLAYVQFASPTLEDVAAQAEAEGARRVRVLPLFMTQAGHVDKDIRSLVDTVRDAHPELRVDLLPPVGLHEGFRELLVHIAEEDAR